MATSDMKSRGDKGSAETEIENAHACGTSTNCTRDVDEIGDEQQRPGHVSVNQLATRTPTIQQRRLSNDYREPERAPYIASQTAAFRPEIKAATTSTSQRRFFK
jgi:hypothetical protein